MKYFTKEWFADTILAEMCFQVRKSAKAAVFSEKYCDSLRKEQKKWFIKNEKFIAKHNKVKFDLAAAEAAFEANCIENLDYVKANLPVEILSRVADIRVLALGSAEPQIVDEITRFCGRVNARCEAVSEAYNTEIEKLAESIGWEKINLMERLLGSKIELCEAYDGKNFAFATDKEYTGVPCRVDLIDANVITCDDGLVGSAVANVEILPSESGAFVFSVLCQKLDGTMLEFSAEMKDFDVI
jgi:hypothetical protein